MYRRPLKKENVYDKKRALVTITTCSRARILHAVYCFTLLTEASTAMNHPTEYYYVSINCLLNRVLKCDNASACLPKTVHTQCAICDDTIVRLLNI